MRKSNRKLELNAHTIATLSRDDLASAAGGGRSKTGNCPVDTYTHKCPDR